MMQSLFEKIMKGSFAEVAHDELKKVVLAVWHEGFVPDVRGLNVTSGHKAVYLLDRLRRFNCVGASQRTELSNLIDFLSLKYGFRYMPMAFGHPSVEKHARAWGLNCDLKHHIRALMPYQTRHYQHQNQETA